MPASHQQRKKPNPQFKHDSARCWVEQWDVRMASRYCLIEVRCSTEPQPEDEPLHIYKRHEPEGDAWLSVIDHLTWQAAMGALQPGVWTITVPGTDRKHSFEVE